MEQIDVYWSFRSPYSYLATPELVQLGEDYNVEVNLRVVLPIAVRSKATLFNAADPKPVRYIILDAVRRSEMLGMPIVLPMRPDPITQNLETMEVAKEQPLIYRISKLGVEAQRQGKGVLFAKEVSHMVFGGTDGWDKGDHLANAARTVGLDLAQMEAAIADGDHLAEIETNQDNLEKAGHWGVPTMVARGEPFFGQDRMDTLRWRLDQYKLRK